MVLLALGTRARRLIRGGSTCRLLPNADRAAEPMAHGTPHFRQDYQRGRREGGRAPRRLEHRAPERGGRGHARRDDREPVPKRLGDMTSVEWKIRFSQPLRFCS